MRTTLLASAEKIKKVQNGLIKIRLAVSTDLKKSSTLESVISDLDDALSKIGTLLNNTNQNIGGQARQCNQID